MTAIKGWAAGLALAAGLLAASPAAAGIKFNAGDLAITTIADLEDRADLRMGGRAVKLGWMHREVSILQGAFWIWDEQGYVLFYRDGLDYSYAPIPKSEGVSLARSAGVEVPADGASPLGIWDRFAGAIVLGGLILLGIVSKLRRRRAAA